MSLSVYLTTPSIKCRESSGIFIREGGQLREISREEWDDRNPGHEPNVVASMAESNEVFAQNITHNLWPMAEAAGIYNCLWRPDEIGITKARQLFEPLRAGLALLKSDPERFEKYNPANGWGSYNAFVPWVENYLSACYENPEADVCVSR